MSLLLSSGCCKNLKCKNDLSPFVCIFLLLLKCTVCTKNLCEINHFLNDVLIYFLAKETNNEFKKNKA